MPSAATSDVDTDYLERAARLLAAPKQAGLAASAAAGGRVLDVGCGPGVDTVELARRMGPDGRVDGVDADPAMVAAADRRAGAAGLADRVRHSVAPADALPFATATFDATRAERLLQHIAEPAATVAEMVRVTRPGGAVVLVDTDWASLSLAGGDRSVERRVTAGLLTMVPNPTAGRDLRALLVHAGAVGVTMEPFVVAFTDLDLARFLARLTMVEQRLVAAGSIGAGEAERWQASCVELDAADAFYGHAVMTVAVGRVAS